MPQSRRFFLVRHGNGTFRTFPIYRCFPHWKCPCIEGILRDFPLLSLSEVNWVGRNLHIPRFRSLTNQLEYEALGVSAVSLWFCILCHICPRILKYENLDFCDVLNNFAQKGASHSYFHPGPSPPGAASTTDLQAASCKHYIWLYMSLHVLTEMVESWQNQVFLVQIALFIADCSGNVPPYA